MPTSSIEAEECFTDEPGIEAAWDQVEFALANRDADLTALRTMMAARMMAAVRDGERDPERLTELALAGGRDELARMLRARHAGGRRCRSPSSGLRFAKAAGRNLGARSRRPAAIIAPIAAAAVADGRERHAPRLLAGHRDCLAHGWEIPLAGLNRLSGRIGIDPLAELALHRVRVRGRARGHAGNGRVLIAGL